MFLIHDDDLKRVDGLGDDTVSRCLISSYSVAFSSDGRQSLEVLQPDVLMDLLRRSNINVHAVQCGKLSTFTQH